MTTAKIALLFPGQGSQLVGMGHDVAAQAAVAQAVFAAADEALGEPISQRCFQGPDDELKRTATTQPALVATSMALLAALRERVPQLRPAYAAGHSLGEYSALVAAGALSFDDAVRLVRRRGQAMQEAVPVGQGGMAAVMGLSPSDVEAVCAEAAGDEVLRPANFNGSQIVIAGHTAAVARAAELVTKRGGKAVILAVSAPFHSPLMAPAVRAMEGPLREVTVHPPNFPVVSNVEARPNSDAGRVTELLLRQIDGPVRWDETIRWLVHEGGVTHAVEVGPGKVLAGLAKRIEKSLVVLPCGDVATLASTSQTLTDLIT